jgi:hypothetical protein
MRRPAAAAAAAPPPLLLQPVLAPKAIQVAVRSSGGDGSRVLVVDAPARGTIADVKRLLCLPPHSICSDALALELVLKGEGAAAAVFNWFDLRLTLWRAGCILRDDAALAPAAAPQGVLFTAVLLVCGSHHAPKPPQPTCAARCAPSLPTPTAIDVSNRNAAEVHVPLYATAAAPADPSSESASSFSPAQTTAPSPAPAAAALQHGSRVRVEGLHTAPQMNGRTGVVRGVFNQETGRWTVDVAAEGAWAACRGMFHPSNLRLVPSHNFSTEWVDEGGRVWPKHVEFSRQCAKGHALAPLGERGGQADRRLMCRLCHCFCRCGCDEAASWLMCSEDVACCGEYAVCCSCARLPSAAAAACAGSDEFQTQVSCRAALFV